MKLAIFENLGHIFAKWYEKGYLVYAVFGGLILITIILWKVIL
jgi:hypothetical protein